MYRENLERATTRSFVATARKNLFCWNLKIDYFWPEDSK